MENIKVSNGYQAFMAEPAGAAFGKMVNTLAESSALDSKTQHLAYISVLAAVGNTGGLPFHVQMAKADEASLAEIKSAVLVGLPAVGLTVLSALGLAIDTWHKETEA